MPRKVHTHITSDTTTSVIPKYLTKQEFGRRLYSLMIAKGWHQSELARQSSIPRDSISTYVRGRSLPTPQNLELLAGALGVTAEELLPDYAEASVADEENPSFEMRVSGAAPGTAWVRVNRLVSMTAAIEIARILENDHVSDGKRSGDGAAVQPVEDKTASA